MGRRTTLLLIVCALAVVTALLTGVGLWSRAAAEQELAARGEGILALYVGNLDGRLARFETVPQLLAQMPEVRNVLADPDDPDMLTTANTHLAFEAVLTGALDIYVMDARGVTLAASNWNTEYSFVGRNFAFRPYFQDAMAGRVGRYFALGTTSLQRGYYFSAPVTLGNEIAGAIVVKMDPAKVETAWQDLRDRIVVTDPDGVIFISSHPDWLYHALRPLSPEAREEITSSRRYPGVRVTELPATERPSDIPGATVLALDGRPQRFLHQSAFMAEAGWTVHILSDMRPVDEQVVKHVSLVGLLLALALAVGMGTRLRLQSLRAAAAALAAKEEAVRRANDQLEKRVRQRTAELEEAHDRLRQAQDNLVHASRLAGIGQLAAGVTHELNQPLTAMRAYADNARILLARDRLADVEQNLARIGDLVDRVADISGRLKRFASRTRPESAPVRLDDVLRTSVELVEVGTRLRGLAIVNRAAGTPLHVLGERVRLEQVFVNLLRNAVEAVRDRAERRVTLALAVEDGFASVSVADTGPGLTAEALEHLAEPFFSSKRPGEGVGLGLSISNGIVNDFGGTLTAENRPEGGALFTVRLKLAAAAASAPCPDPADAHA